jgi:hypothetical protein
MWSRVSALELHLHCSDGAVHAGAQILGSKETLKHFASLLEQLLLVCDIAKVSERRPNLYSPESCIQTVDSRSQLLHPPLQRITVRGR